VVRPATHLGAVNPTFKLAQERGSVSIPVCELRKVGRSAGVEPIAFRHGMGRQIIVPAERETTAVQSGGSERRPQGGLHLTGG